MSYARGELECLAIMTTRFQPLKLSDVTVHQVGMPWCFDRITNNELPACVKSCPTGAMQFGKRDEILDATNNRVAELKKTHPKAQAINPDEVRVIYIVKDDPKTYWKFATGK